ncbi:hypothetical protein IV02_10535 [Pseudomonas syringae]|uniref:Uncharacterized protein n=2 Tax=Pseudomonas syringae TaxID=317 RepID=A0A085V9Q7_PSESX|nr:hypothetical protein IV02_10535 [Pseudomonas syringae]
MGVGAAKIIALMVLLRDELGIPIIVAGTYKALKLLEGDLCTSRRLVEGGYYDLVRPKSAEEEGFYELCNIAWLYQWTREHTDFSLGVCDALYEVSQGITGIMLSVLAGAQLAAIEDGSEKVDEKLIRKVFEERMTPLHPAIQILKSKNERHFDKFDEAYASAHAPFNHTSEILSKSSTRCREPARSGDPVFFEQQKSATSPKAESQKKAAKYTPGQFRDLVLEGSTGKLSNILDNL